MLSIAAKDIMTRDVVTILRGATIEDALKKMADSNVSGLPVVDADDCLVGIITESDVLLKGQFAPPGQRAGPVGIFAPRADDGLDEAHRRAQSALVEEAMTRKLVVFAEDSLVVDIARAMMEHAVNRVPIVSGRKVVGIVSRRDIVKAMSRAANARA